jgi:hypothetical protein
LHHFLYMSTHTAVFVMCRPSPPVLIPSILLASISNRYHDPSPSPYCRKASSTAPLIKWNNYNYPSSKEPFNLIHFDLTELKGVAGDHALSIARRLHASYIISIVLLVYNCKFIICTSSLYHGEDARLCLDGTRNPSYGGSLQQAHIFV